MFLQIFSYPRDGSAGAHARDKRVDMTFKRDPNLLARLLVVTLRVRRVLELHGDPRAGDRRVKFFRAANRSLHPLRAGREFNLRPVRRGKLATFHAHRLGHR